MHTPDGPHAHSLAIARAVAWEPHAAAALAALADTPGVAATEALLDALLHAPSRQVASIAVTALGARDELVATEALIEATTSPYTVSRTAACRALADRRHPAAPSALRRVLARDESWITRTAALDALAAAPDTRRDRDLLIAADDPHWRLRYALARTTLDARDAALLDHLPDHPAARALGAYLAWRFDERGHEPAEHAAPAEPWAAAPFADPDPAVMLRDLKRTPPRALRDLLRFMPDLLIHPFEPLRAFAADLLKRHITPTLLTDALIALADPRRAGVAHATRALLHTLDLDEAEEAALHILDDPHPHPAALAWAIDQIAHAFPPELVAGRLQTLLDPATTLHPAPRAALARLLGRHPHPDAPALLDLLARDPDPDTAEAALTSAPTGALRIETIEQIISHPDHAPRAAAARHALAASAVLASALAADPDPRVRRAVASKAPDDHPLRAALRRDPNPTVRAAALTAEAAHTLLADPGAETSWIVINRAAHLAATPAWTVLPSAPWTPPQAPPGAPPPIHAALGPPPHARPLGATGLLVPPLLISGHYLMPVEGFEIALAEGVNLFFWEPSYGTLTTFMQRLDPARRRDVNLLVGTFEADAEGVRRDVERALRLLRIERIALFLVFWTRSWRRVEPSLIEALDALRDEGRIGAWSLSTHDRQLAVEALDRGFDPIMVRHSMAHRGAERAVLPHALQRGAAVITFNATCYGRLLQPHGPLTPPTPAECYRYSLAQPGVTCCFSAPADLDQLRANLDVLRDPGLDPGAVERLRAHGDLVYRENSVFSRLIRWF